MSRIESSAERAEGNTLINERRDQKAAYGAVHMAADHNKKIAVAVDDDICLEAMLPRVTKLLDGRGLKYEVTRPGSGVVEVKIDGAGTINIVAADRLTGKPGN